MGTDLSTRSGGDELFDFLSVLGVEFQGLCESEMLFLCPSTEFWS